MIFVLLLMPENVSLLQKYHSIIPNLMSTELAAGHTKSSSSEEVCIFVNRYKITTRVFPPNRSLKTRDSSHMSCLFSKFPYDSF